MPINNSDPNSKDDIEVNVSEVISGDGFEDELEEMDVESLPIFNKRGYRMFDSNGNIPISDGEREEMISELRKKFTEIMDILRIY